VSDLGPEAQQLIQAGRSALRPSVADRERIAAALRARGGLFPEPALAAPARLGWAHVSATVVGLGAVGLFVASGAWERTAPPAPAVPPPAPVSASLVSAPADGARVSESTASLPAVEPTHTVGAKPKRAAAKPPADRLAEEVDILSRAQAEMHAGRFGGALTLIEQHARSFPRGTLAPERRAARVQALCALGQRTEADAELTRLAPGSLHEARAREACTVPASSKVR
jgi:RNA polymerase sigma-70 factor (ECF subfamily)